MMTEKERKYAMWQWDLKGHSDPQLKVPVEQWVVEGAYLLGRDGAFDGFVKCVATEGLGNEEFAEVIMLNGKTSMFSIKELQEYFECPVFTLTHEEREQFLKMAKPESAIPYSFADFAASNPVEKEEELPATSESDNFYLVWSLQKGTPTKRHTSRDAAEQEAARLAEKHPGVEFFVVEAISRVKGYVSVSLEQLV